MGLSDPGAVEALREKVWSREALIKLLLQHLETEVVEGILYEIWDELQVYADEHKQQMIATLRRKDV